MLLDAEGGRETGRQVVGLIPDGQVVRARQIAGLGVEVLICGAVSRSFEAMLNALGVQVVPNTCGSVDEVLEAYASGRMTDESYLMPGCCGRGRGRRHRRRHRHRGGPGR